jgi:exopolysaccharide production protein ExoZ
VAAARRQIYTIQYARAALAILVVTWHAGGLHELLADRVYILYGFLFISGYVMFLPSTRGGQNLKQYALPRLARLAPVYWLLTLALFGYALAVVQTSHGVVTWRQLLLSLLFIPHNNALNQPYPILIPGWYLTYDVALVLLLGLLASASEARRFWVVQLVLLSLVVVGVVVQPTNPVGFRLTDQILLAFMAGAATQKLLTRWSPSRSMAAAMVAGGLAMWCLPWPVTMALSWPALVSGLPMVIALTGAIALDKPGDRRLPLLGWIGDASMSIYLWHEIGMSLCQRALALIGIDAPAGASLIGGVFGLALGLAAYPLVERPVTEWVLARVKPMNAVIQGASWRSRTRAFLGR